jgi:hypothetical protein
LVGITAGVTAALTVAGVLGLAFSSTRGMAIAAIAALTFIYPALVIPILALVGVLLYLRHFRK